MLQPWFQPRSAMPNAAVDFPFMSPVWTMSSGRLRRCFVVSPSSGTLCGTPCGILSNLPVGADRVGDRPGRQVTEVLQVQVHGTERLRQGDGEAEPYRPRLAVDDDASDVVLTQPRGRHGGVAALGVAAVGDDDEERPAPWVAQPLAGKGGVRLS